MSQTSKNMKKSDRKTINGNFFLEIPFPCRWQSYKPKSGQIDRRKFCF